MNKHQERRFYARDQAAEFTRIGMRLQRCKDHEVAAHESGKG